MRRRALTAAGLMTFVIWTMCVAPASALDDGGGRSVFARGAGERALALGGAYVAVADDPAAMIWNPAGLARLEQKSLYASHSNLIGLGFSEQMGLLALPNWRLGTFGLGVRRFGVDGIEGRDRRGTIFDDNLKDAETEILLGYGKQLAGIWNLGLVAKYQQQTLAGYSDGAPGLDIGVLVRPLEAAGRQSNLAHALSLGFAIRNLIEPNIRLDEDGVKDPTGLRLGAAYDGAVAGNLNLLLATDIEKTRDMDTRLHAGAELRLMDLLGLRVGSLAGMLTAGVGLRYHNVAFDYAFEDNPLETMHRFGLKIAFGPTTNESKQASLTARDAAFQTQLSEAFQAQNRSRVQTIVTRVQQDLAGGAYDNALNGIESVRVLQPDYPGLDKYEADAFFGQGSTLEKQGDLPGAAIALQRCLALAPERSDAQESLQRVSAQNNLTSARTEVIRNQFDTALKAYADGDLVGAQQGFGKILELQPDDREASALLQSTTQTLNLRANLLIDQTRALVKAGDIMAARASLAKAKALAPDLAAIAEVEAQISAREQQVAAAAEAKRRPKLSAQGRAPKKPPITAPTVKPTYAALSAKERQDVADLYKRGLQAVIDDQHADAIRYRELVWSRAPDYPKVAENLKEEYLAQGMEAFAQGQLEQSIVLWEKAQNVAPGDPRTEGYLMRAYEHRARIQEIKGH